MLIIFHLFSSSTLRFSEIHRLLEGASHKVLTDQLRDLEQDGVISRTVHAEVPPRVEYKLTRDGLALQPALLALQQWSLSRTHSIVDSYAER
mgnify:CR=1 FL=1